MTGDWLPAAAAIVGTAIGGAVTWVVAYRKSSGRVRTTEAETLWAASESIRHDLTAAIAAKDAELSRMKADILSFTVELERIKEDNRRLNVILEVFRQRMEGD